MKQFLLSVGLISFVCASGFAQASLPAIFPIGTQEEFNTYSTVDANADGKTWKFESRAACYEGIGTSYADDWLILGPIDLSNPANSFTLTLEAWKTYLAESYEVCLSPTGQTADAISIYSTSDVPNSAAPISFDFSVPTPGTYHLMIHANSPSNGISLYVRNVQVQANEAEGFSVPFEMTPAADEARFFTMLDNNGDSKTWGYDLTNQGFAIECSTTSASDDWLLFPEVAFPEAGRYLFQWDARSWGDPQMMDILVGQGDDTSAYRVIFKDTEIGGTLYTREVVFEISEPGAYRVAFHSYTPANRYKLLTKNYRITATDKFPATPLPLEVPGIISVGTDWTFSPAFTFDAGSRVKVSFNLSGDGITYGFANAPAGQAVSSAYEAAEAGTVEKVIWLPAEGIGYFGFKSTGTSTISNLRVALYNEADEANQLPFLIQPTADEFADFKVVNNNGDSSTWTYYDHFGAARYNWSNTDKADDWLILPAVNIPDANHMISFSLNARGMAVTLPETFEIWAGQENEIEDMVKLYESPEVRTEQFSPYSFSFSPRWTGVTYFAVRATSEPKMFHLFVRDFNIQSEERMTTIPLPVSELTAAPAIPGSTEAKVNFRLPLLNEAGNELDATALLTATVSSSEASTTATGRPGELLTVVVENGQGEGVITVIVSNAFGDSNPASVKVYTGVDRPSPANIISVKADETNRKATVSWTMAETGAAGGYVDPEGVTYTIRHSVSNGSYQAVGSVTGANEFVYSIPDSYPLQMHYFMVVPSNVAGEGDQGKGLGIILGQPHAIPASEDFSSGTIELGPLGMAKPDDSYTLDWYFDNPANGFDEAANLSGKALIAFTEEEGAARGRLNLPKFDTRTEKGARIAVRVFNYPHFAPTAIYGEISDGEPVLIGNIEPSAEAGWKEYSFGLPDQLMNRQWVAPYLDFGFPGSFDDEIWMLDRYEMANYYNVEAEIRPIETHSTMYADTETSWCFEISNFGKNEISFAHPMLNFTTVDGVSKSFSAVNTDDLKTLAPGEKCIYTFNVELGTSFEDEIAWDISINVDGDGNRTNNWLAGTTTVYQQEEFVVRDLSGSLEGNEVHLNWSAPSTGYGILYVDNLRSWDYGPKLGMFTNYDADGMIETGFVGVPFPGMNQPKAWQVFDYEAGGFDFIYAGYLASAKSLIAFSPASGLGAADDWLISPEVKGETMLTFYVRPLHFGYGQEKVEIMVSNTTDNPEAFTLLDTYLTQAGDPSRTPYWEEVEVDLPADARFFAIRYRSNDIFGLQLDDIIYTPAQENEEDLKYSVFCNDMLIASGVDGTEFIGTAPHSDGVYTVAVEKMYGGLYPKSNELYLESSGIASFGAPGAEPIYFDLEGRRISAPSEPGIYIRIQGSDRRKIVVR